MALPFVDTDTVISSAQTPATGEALIFNAADISITIDTNVAIVSRDDDAIFSVNSGSTLINNGNVFSAAATGVVIAGNNSEVVNNAGHSIIGWLNGVTSNGGDGHIVTNHGTVSGLTNIGVGFFNSADNPVLNNHGDIFGDAFGILMAPLNSGGTIHNSGMIRSSGKGLRLETDTPGTTTVIDNKAGGLIQGDDDAIFAFSGRMSLNNRGRIDGDIDSNASNGNVNDVIINPGKIIGDVFLGLGNDTFRGKGGGSSGDVFGEAGNDTLIGGRARDTLDGGPDNDLLRGGRGKDSLFGGNDRDLFDFNSIGDSVRGTKRDVIEDFQRGNNVTGDDIDLRTIDAKAGVAGNQKFKFIGKQDFHDTKGELRIEDKGARVIVQGDVNGDGKADFEILVKVGALSAGDFLL